jgi:NitT/TauT family transport system substrate-binding protein
MGDMKGVVCAARWVVAAVLFVVVAGCAREAAPLRIGLHPWPPFEYLHLAREKGFFAAEGVDVRLVEFVEASDAFRAYDHGKIDGGTFSLIQVLRVRDSSRLKLQVGMITDYSDGQDAILARPGIDDVPALRGKRVGVSEAPLTVYLLARALELHGMTLDDVTLVRILDMQTTTSLRSGLVDAVMAYPPVRSEVEREGLARPIFTSREIPGEIVDALAFQESIFQERPEDVARVIRAFYRAVRYAQEQPQEAMRIMAAREKLDAETFRQALTEGLTLAKLEEQERLLGADSQLAQVVRRIAGTMHELGVLSTPHYGGEVLNPEAAALAAAP